MDQSWKLWRYDMGFKEDICNAKDRSEVTELLNIANNIDDVSLTTRKRWQRVANNRLKELDKLLEADEALKKKKSKKKK